jgi:starch phosphorylase
VDQAGAGKHGAIDAPLLGKPRGYSEQHYLTAAAAYRGRAANKGVVSRQVVDWQHAVDQKWSSARFGDLRVETSADHHVFEVEIFLNDLGQNAGRV